LIIEGATEKVPLFIMPLNLVYGENFSFYEHNIFQTAKKFITTINPSLVLLLFLVKQIPGRGPEQTESEKTVLSLQIIILISYIIFYY
jgi:hypothetical protein